MPIVDPMHALSYVYTAAVESSTDMDSQHTSRRCPIASDKTICGHRRHLRIIPSDEHVFSATCVKNAPALPRKFSALEVACA
jgi:hypothetical protein